MQSVAKHLQIPQLLVINNEKLGVQDIPLTENASKILALQKQKKKLEDGPIRNIPDSCENITDLGMYCCCGVL